MNIEDINSAELTATETLLKNMEYNIQKQKEEKYEEYIAVLKTEAEKKDKVINEMSIYVNSPLRIPEEKYCEFYNSDEDCCWKTDKECKDCIIEYFTNKVEREGK